MSTGCFISVGSSLASAIERVQLADTLGYEAIYTTHIAGWESMIVTSTFAAHCDRARVGTGVVPIYTRTPATMAQTAASIDTLSAGRFTLGLGVSHRAVIEGWHGQSIDRPVREMREYVSIVRAILRGENPPSGERWHSSFHLAGLETRPDLPIYLAGLSPAMLRAAGELADGVILWLCNPHYIREVVIPELAIGRERAGLTLEGFDVVAAVPSALSEDRDQAHQALRRDLLPYFALPFYRAMLERSGFGDDIRAYDAASGDLPGMMSAISDDFLELLGAVGDRAAVLAGIERYRQSGASSPCIGAISGSDFNATLQAAVG